MPAENKQTIINSFSRSAYDYDMHISVQKQMMEKVFALVDKEYPSILDVGCGTGTLAGWLAESFPFSRIEGIDAASGMIRVAMDKKLSPNVSFYIDDGEHLSSASGKYDLVVSSAALQWMDTEKAIMEVQRVLKPGGKFIFSTFGPRTLEELKNAGLAVNPFLKREELYHLLSSYFVSIILTSEITLLPYKDVFALFRYLRAIGAQTPVKVERKGLLTKNRLKTLFPAKEEGIKVSYEIYYGVCTKAAYNNIGTREF